MCNLSKVTQYVSSQTGAILISLKEAYIEGKGWIKVAVPTVMAFHTLIDIERNVNMMIAAGATRFGFLIKNEDGSTTTADFSLNELTT